MASNILFTKNLLAQLRARGVKEWCVCAGSRNSPFVETLSHVSDGKVWWGFEERSMAFFALGRARASQAPVAIITTSGTAVAETLPAVIEAFHSGESIVVISCDRPERLIGTGSPQTIEQSQMLCNFSQFFSFDPHQEKDLLALEELPQTIQQPWHINVHLDEPLIDGELSAWSVRELSAQITLSPKLPALVQTKQQKFSEVPLPQALQTFLQNAHSPFVCLGPMSASQSQQIKPILIALGLPILAEASSQLREDPDLVKWILPLGEHSLNTKRVDGILRIGHVPTAKFWRNLEKSQIPVLSIAPPPYWPGLGRFNQLFPWDDLQSVTVTDSLKKETLSSLPINLQLQTLFEMFPLSEPAMVRRLSEIIPIQSHIYLGNSLPIRVWDWAAVRSKPFVYGCNRGANGIDGQISSFLGWSSPATENWAVVGDLTALYDVTAFWCAQKLSERKLRVVVINNGGGQIFSHIYKNPAFVNSHNLSFKGVAELWSWGYCKWDSSAPLAELKQQQLIEIMVDSVQTKNFYDELNSLKLKAIRSTE